MSLKSIFKKSVFYKLFIYSWAYYWANKAKKKVKLDRKNILKQWLKDGRPLPPPQAYKVSVIQKYALKYNSHTLIETGTYLGDTLEACSHIFKKLISIELDHKLYESAVSKFINDPHITIYEGDSGKMLKKILPGIKESCLFWLDGHYSEGFTAKGDLNTPIINELTTILKNNNTNNVILIDDARCFSGEDDYPTLAFLKDFVAQHDKNLKFEVENDMIRIY